MRGRRAKRSFNIKYILVAVALVILLTTIIVVKVKSSSNAKNVAKLEQYTENITNEEDENQEEELLIVSIDQLPEELGEVEKVNENKATQVQGSNAVKVNSSSRYYIKVNYQANVVTIYQNSGGGEFTPVRAMVCSTGTHTPRSGQYSLKYRWEWLGLQGDVYGHYVTQITGNILFHSVPYLTKYNPSSLEYWEFDKLGTSASLGCVRLQIKDCKWIYDNCSSGTIVEFYGDADPGPLGKPSAPKISSNIACRNWDPTDPNASNPWNNSSVSSGSTVVVNNNDSTGTYEKEEEKIREITQATATPTPTKTIEPTGNNENNYSNTTMNNEETRNNTEKHNTINNGGN